MSPFTGMGPALYYTLITMTTVGYGDLSPTTELGRCMAIIIALSGVIVIAIPASVITTNFGEGEMHAECGLLPTPTPSHFVHPPHN